MDIQEQRLRVLHKSTSRWENTTATSRRRKRTRSCTSRTNIEKQHNEQTSSTSSHNFYPNIKIFHIEHNNNSSSWRHRKTREEHLDHLMEAYKKDLGDNHIPFINMIDVNNYEQRSRPRSEQQRLTTLPLENGRIQQTSWRTSFSGSNNNNYSIRVSSSHLEGDEGEGGEETSRRRVRKPSPTSAASVQSLLRSDTSIVVTTRLHWPKASIIVTTLFSILYFVSHQSLTSCCHLTSSQLAKVYISCTAHRRKLRATSNTSRNLHTSRQGQLLTSQTSVELLVGTSTTDIGTSITGITATTSWTLGRPQEAWHYEQLFGVPHQAWCHLHRTTINGTSRTSTTGLMSRSSGRTTSTSRTSFSGTSVLYIRMIKGGIHRSHGEWVHTSTSTMRSSWPTSTSHFRLATPTYQHIHLHQQATDAINFKITSCLLLGTNDKIDNNWKGMTSHRTSASLPSWSRWMNLAQGTSCVLTGENRANVKSLSSTSLHQYLRCTSTALDISSSSSRALQVRTSLTRSTIQPSSAHICLTKHRYQDLSTLNSRSLFSLRNYETIWPKSHRHITTYFPRMMQIMKCQEEATSTSKTIGRTSSSLGTSTLTTNVMHSEGATATTTWTLTDIRGTSRPQWASQLHIVDIWWATAALCLCWVHSRRETSWPQYIWEGAAHLVAHLLRELPLRGGVKTSYIYNLSGLATSEIHPPWGAQEEKSAKHSASDTTTTMVTSTQDEKGKQRTSKEKDD